MPLLSTNPSRSPQYHWITGNLPPLSPDLCTAHGTPIPDPSDPWETLFDPLLSEEFSWNRATLQRDESDLECVPLQGVLSYGRYLRLCTRLILKVWRERWDEGSGRVFYWNVRTGETCWEQPGEFWGLGLTLDPLWTLYPLLPEPADHHSYHHRSQHHHHTYTHCVHRVTGEVVAFEGGGIKEEGAATKLPLWVDAWRLGASQWTRDPFFAYGEWLNRDTGERCTDTPAVVLQAKERGGGGSSSKQQQQQQIHVVFSVQGGGGIKQGQRLLLQHQQKLQQEQGGKGLSTLITPTSPEETPPPAMPPNAPLLSPYEVELYRGVLEEELAKEDRVCDMGTIYLQDGARGNGLGGGGWRVVGDATETAVAGAAAADPSHSSSSSGTTSTTLHTQHTITVKLDPLVTSKWEKDWDYHAPPTLPSLLSNPASSSLSGGVVGDRGRGRVGRVGRGVGGGGSPPFNPGTVRGGTPTTPTTPTPNPLYQHLSPPQRTPSARALQGLPAHTTTITTTTITPSRTRFPDLHGYLYKRGGGTSLLSAMSFNGGVGWKRRFFVSHGGILSYYTSEEHFTAGEPPIKRHGLDLFHYRVMDHHEQGGMVGEFALVPRLASYAVLSLASGRGRAVGAAAHTGVGAAGAGAGAGASGGGAHGRENHHHYTLQGANPDRAFYLRVGEEEGGGNWEEVAALAEAWKEGLRGVVEEVGGGGGGGGGGTPTPFPSSLSPYHHRLESISGEVRGERAWVGGLSKANPSSPASAAATRGVSTAASPATTTAATPTSSRDGSGGVRVDSRTLMAIGGLSLKWVAGKEALEGLMGGNDGGAAFTNTYAPFRDKPLPQIKLNPVRDLQQEQHQQLQKKFMAAAATAAAVGAFKGGGGKASSSVTASATGGRVVSSSSSIKKDSAVYGTGSIPPPPSSSPPPPSGAPPSTTAQPAKMRMSPPPPPPGPPPPHAHPDYYFHSSAEKGRQGRWREEEGEEGLGGEEREKEEEGEYEGIRDDLSFPFDDVPSRVTFSGDCDSDGDGGGGVRGKGVAAPFASVDAPNALDSSDRVGAYSTGGVVGVAADAEGSGKGGGGGREGGRRVVSEKTSPPPPRKPYLSPPSAQASTKRNGRFSWGVGGGLLTSSTTTNIGGGGGGGVGTSTPSLVTSSPSATASHTDGEEGAQAPLQIEGGMGGGGGSVTVKSSGGQVKFSAAAEVPTGEKGGDGSRKSRHYLI